MKALSSLSLDSRELRADGSHDGDTITLRLVGEVGLESLDALGSLLSTAHAEARTLGASLVKVELRALEFMSSSGLKAFVTWIAQAKEAKYRIHFLGTAAFGWQQRSLAALKWCADEIVSVEI